MYLNYEQQPTFPHLNIPLPPRQYNIHISGIGGKMVMESVPDRIASYWNGLDRETLANHIVEKGGRLDLDMAGNRIDENFDTKN